MSQMNKSVLEWLRQLRTTVEYYDYCPNVIFYNCPSSATDDCLLLLLQLDCDFTLKQNNSGMRHIHMDVWPSDVLTWRQQLKFEYCLEEETILETSTQLLPKSAIERENKKTTSVKSVERIRTKLRRFLGKRASREYLESKGIFKNEPIFGNCLANIYHISNETIPLFLRRLVEIIELPANISSVGLYRASGNLAIIQKIRFAIDNNKLAILEQYSNDVDVLAGTLKLFFRELKEPLIPFHIAQQILSKSIPIESLIQQQLSKANRDIFKFLSKHLINVYNHRHENKMNFYNLAVCWGPSLITIPDECCNVVTETAKVSKVVEFLLNHYYYHHTAENCNSPITDN